MAVKRRLGTTNPPSTNRDSAEWRAFERAVHAFVSTLDTSAETLFDHSVFDRDTGEPRQCDVWINAKFGGHIPLSILVSCKDLGRNIHVGDIGTFIDEKRSTGATMGIIYSSHGFGKNAVAKARANNIECCRLYQRDRHDVPGLISWEYFLFRAHCRFQVESANEAFILNATLRDALNAQEEGSSMSVCDTLQSILNDHIQYCRHANNIGKVTVPNDSTIEVFGRCEGGDVTFKIRMDVLWDKFRAPVEATLLNGSYCLSNGSFMGEMIGPWIDTWSVHPGPHWIEMANAHPIPSNSIIFFGLPRELSVIASGELGDRKLAP